MCFVNDRKNLIYILGLLNSKIALTALSVLSPIKVPAIIADDNKRVEQLVTQNIERCKADGGSFEISWDFKRDPLV